MSRRWVRLLVGLVIFLFTAGFYSNYQSSLKLMEEEGSQLEWQPFTAILLERPTTVPQKIPMIIWTYWNRGELPELIQDCIKTWKRTNPEYEIRLIGRSTIKKWISIRMPKNFDSQSPPFQADWVRLAVLMEHGGFWIDASFIINTSLQFVHDKQQKEQSEGVQFFNDVFTTYPAYPYFENWFIAAVPNAKYITLWFLEFSKCFEEFGMSDRYLNHLQSEYGMSMYKRLVQGSDAPSYLKQHLALQKVLQVDKAQKPYGLSALKPPLGPFWLWARLSWDPYEFVGSLLNQWNVWRLGDPPALIKLTSYPRDILQLNTLQGFKWIWNLGWWKFWKKEHYRVSRESYYCTVVKHCNKTAMPVIPKGVTPYNPMAYPYPVEIEY